MKQSAKAKAHTNIALIKYWGKKDPKLFLPMNSSLSLTLDEFYTETSVEFNKDLEKDRFILNNEEQSEKETQKISQFLNLFRQEIGCTTPIHVSSQNFVPTAAGLASSASAFAALGAAMNSLTEMNMDLSTLSTYVRRGSGSATRSLFGGFVEWQMGDCNENSLAIAVDDASWDIAMITVAVNTKQKSISSREGMQLTVDTSSFYPSWIESATTDLKNIKKAISNKDFEQVGLITESNGMKMHGTMLGALPPFTYMEPLSLEVLAKVREIRGQGWQCYFTMDAGPNVKILCRQSESESIQTLLKNAFPNNPVIISKVGGDVELI
ncbi:diphosphomevalonate decarboxylase [Vagococcus fessus]|uniref:diphosphomevalonate decarboxylase n=1 Tax=Vagococcus fessus TaxID=120370 RepID=A0A430ACS4_9ENTE|nr:diphosphomevalonate decarboxylase [Vagococcus fessus]RSU05019.1 diphosphomevalonate decarboxylase [Vagococcus fessus]